jgi:hypothetical protein
VLDVQDHQRRCGDGTNPPRHKLTLRSALKVILSSEFPRSPTARFPLCALLRSFWALVSSPPWGFLNATVIVSASPS